MPSDNATTSRYYVISVMQTDSDLRARILAGAVAKGATNGQVTDPLFYMRVVSQQTTPTFSDAWTAAVENKNEFPGSDATVITDGMIGSAVLTVLDK